MDGRLWLSSPQATAQLYDFGTQHRILLARTMLSPPEKSARANQYHQ
jgi:hypothetical protein